MHDQTRCVRQEPRRFLSVLLLLLVACAQPQKITELRSIDDRGISGLPSQRKIVMINFWATWCEPCVEEIPMLVKFQDANRSKLTLIGISMDEAKDEKKVRQFLKAHAVTYPVYLRKGSGDFEAMVNSMDPDWIGGLPATFVFNRQKRVFSKTGQLQVSDLKLILERAS